MLIGKPAPIPSSEITPKSTYLNRRSFLAGAAIAGAAAVTGIAFRNLTDPALTSQANAKIDGVQKSPFSTTEKETPYKDVTNDGQVKKKQVLDVDTIIKMAAPEERIYRHRCVEGWSIVVPWIGFSLSELIKRADPLPKAKYVEFTTLYDPKQMPGQRVNVLAWPYVEGLRMDEAMHPLALLCFGMYGEVLPNQDGAPLRIVLPWKYGFKSAKSIVRIRFTDSQPLNTWQQSAPNEYGFYSNVNPNVDHPRWSQAKERRLGEFLKRPTLMFNGYDQVASLYSGMDLKKNF